MRVKLLTIQRQGDVMWRVNGSYHCGGYEHLRANGLLPIRWDISVTCKPKLDGRGFLFDQAQLASWIALQAKEATELSCERLVIDLAHRCEGWIERDDPSIELVGLAISLSPEPYSAKVIATLAPQKGWIP